MFRISVGTLLAIITIVCADFAYREFNPEFREWQRWKNTRSNIGEALFNHLQKLNMDARVKASAIQEFESQNPNFTQSADLNAEYLDLIKDLFATLRQISYWEEEYYSERIKTLKKIDNVPNIDDIPLPSSLFVTQN